MKAEKGYIDVGDQIKTGVNFKMLVTVLVTPTSTISFY